MWVPGDAQELTATASNTQSGDLLANYLTDAGRDIGPGMTIERVVGSIQFESLVTGSDSNFSCGLLVVPEGGLTSFPASRTEVASWLWWFGGLATSAGNEQAAGVFQPLSERIQFDVKARRRFTGMGDELRFMLQSGSSVGLLLSIHVRTLIRVGS